MDVFPRSQGIVSGVIRSWAGTVPSGSHDGFEKIQAEANLVRLLCVCAVFLQRFGDLIQAIQAFHSLNCGRAGLDTRTNPRVERRWRVGCWRKHETLLLASLSPVLFWMILVICLFKAGNCFISIYFTEYAKVF